MRTGARSLYIHSGLYRRTPAPSLCIFTRGVKFLPFVLQRQPLAQLCGCTYHRFGQLQVTSRELAAHHIQMENTANLKHVVLCKSVTITKGFWGRDQGSPGIVLESTIPSRLGRERYMGLPAHNALTNVACLLT